MRAPTQGAVALTGAIVAALALVTGACAPARVDVTQVTPCAHEYGPSPDGPAPCVWDAATQGTQGPNGYDTRWIYYSANTCPVATVQAAADVRCLQRSDWDGS